MDDRRYLSRGLSSRPRTHSTLLAASASGGSAIAGGVAGVTDVIITYPTDYIKTQLQLDEKQSSAGLGRKMYSGVVDCVSKTIKADGFPGLYRGMSVVLLGSFPRAAVRFCAFETLKNNFLQDDGMLSYKMKAVCGLGAGLCESLLTVTPFECVKVKFITDNRSEKRKFKGLIHGIRTIFKEEGLAGFYQGLIATMLKQGISQSIRFSVMETCKDQYWKGDQSKQIPIFLIIFFGAFSGAISVFGTTPFDVVQTRMQSLEASKYKNTANCIMRIWVDEGFTAFYKGLLPRLIRVCFGSGVTFFTYETIQAYL
ncbi:hypothetical protein LSTR_LSTR003851 [Laodelphax striatellus]|uniref:Citrate transport protein n=1 Tax=Laodelphax striatellus TaxID=195883 RepID=A0A482XFR9_LAOST|nr:hypothetical protein LSTR_LSTR003851 [Laodelphax striatellus]